MRIGAFLMSLAVLAALAAAHRAEAQPLRQGQSQAKTPGRFKTPAGLRGSIQAAPAAAFAGATSKPRVSPAKPIVTSLAKAAATIARPDAGQCRTGCAHSYYFCLSDGVTLDCPQTWSQCLSGCNHPPPPIAR
jgi:hypothetical protein